MSIETHPTRPGWYYVKYYPEGRNKPPRRTPVESYAKALALDKAIKEAKGSPQQITTRPRLETIAEDYLLWVKQNQAERTHFNKCGRLRKFILPALGKYRVQDLSQRILDEYSQRLTRAMYRQDIVHLMALIRWMIKRQYAAPLDWQPELPTVISKIKPLPSAAEILATIAAVKRESARMLFTMSLYTGLRPGEVRQLRWENCRENTIILLKGKNKIPHAIPVPAPLQEWLEANRKKEGYIFTSSTGKNRPWDNLHGMLALAAKKTGTHLSPHMLRHASATLLLEATGDIYQVQQHLRHTRVTTTEVYLRHSAEKKRKSVDLLEKLLNKKTD